MKKLMIAVAALAAGVAFADGEITSDNVVGYASRAVAQNVFRIVGVPFEGVDSTLEVNKLIPYTTTVSQEDTGWDKNAAQIQVQQANGKYEIYYYIKDALYMNGDTVDDKPGWADYNGILGTPENKELEFTELSGLVTTGGAMWFTDPLNEKSFLTDGGVIKTDVTIDCPAAFRLRSSAFPATFYLNDDPSIEFTGMPDVSQGDKNWEKNAATLQVQKADGKYAIYYYINDALYMNGDTVDDKPGWADYNGILCTPENVAGEFTEQDGKCDPMFGMWANGQTQQFTMKYISPVK